MQTPRLFLSKEMWRLLDMWELVDYKWFSLILIDEGNSLQTATDPQSPLDTVQKKHDLTEDH